MPVSKNNNAPAQQRIIKPVAKVQQEQQQTKVKNAATPKEKLTAVLNQMMKMNEENLINHEQTVDTIAVLREQIKIISSVDDQPKPVLRKRSQAEPEQKQTKVSAAKEAAPKPKAQAPAIDYSQKVRDVCAAQRLPKVNPDHELVWTEYLNQLKSEDLGKEAKAADLRIIIDEEVLGNKDLFSKLRDRATSVLEAPINERKKAFKEIIAMTRAVLSTQ
jgi:hypothetical protein